MSANKAWWKKWLRLANNPGASEVDLTLPLRNGWRIDLKENWPGEPSNLASPLYSGINIAQYGANLLITAPNSHAAEYTIYTIGGLPIGGLALSHGETKSITLPSWLLWWYSMVTLGKSCCSLSIISWLDTSP